MTTKKVINAFLGVLTIAIYGGLIYRYFGNDKADLAQIELVKIQKRSIKQDTVAQFKLELINRDPFLDKPIYTEKKVAKEKPKVLPKTAPPGKKISVSWPKVEYFGFISVGEDKTAVLRIAGALKRLKEGQAFQGLIINRVSKDSICISYRREKKYVKRS